MEKGGGATMGRKTEVIVVVVGLVLLFGFLATVVLSLFVGIG